MSSLLGDKEVVVLDCISKKSSVSQRELAKRTGISLGLINVILRRFVENGYVKISHLNKKKVEYLLTPQGLTETVKGIYQFATHTVKKYQRIQLDLSSLLSQLHAVGYDYFSIHGDGELRGFVEMIFQDCLGESPVTLGKEHKEDPRAIVLNLTLDPFPNQFQGAVVNVLEKIGMHQ